CGRGLGDYW
nr:immunoglobulin heavy chain junction region [Homo sapiens]